ncbi:MAG: hypothetical protein R6V15_07800, partial [Desulfotignum sp.]
LDKTPADNLKQVTVSFGSDPLAPEICFTADTVTVSGRDAVFDDIFGNIKDRALLDRVSMHVKKSFTGKGFCLCRTPGKQ